MGEGHTEDGIETTGIITNVNAGSWSEIFSKTPAEHNIEYMQLTINASKDGTFRIKIDGDTILKFDVAARAINTVRRFKSITLNAGSTMVCEYKPDSDGANATAMFGGVKQ